MFGLWWHRGGRSTEGVGYTEVAMTKSMQELLDRMAELPEDEQERIAERFLKELADNARWERILAETQGELRKLGEAAREEYHAGRTEPLDLDRF